MPNSEVTFWSTRQKREVSKTLTVWGDKKSRRSKRSAVLGEQEPWITWWAMNCELSLELQPKNIQPCWQAGVNVWHGRSAYASMCFSVNVYASLSGMLHTLGLPGWVIDLQVKGLRVGALHHSNVVSCPFIGFGQSVSPPVSPVDLASVHSDSKGVGQILMTPQHFNQPRAIVHCWVDSIRPWETTERCIVCKSRDISG